MVAGPRSITLACWVFTILHVAFTVGLIWAIAYGHFLRFRTLPNACDRFELEYRKKEIEDARKAHKRFKTVWSMCKSIFCDLPLLFFQSLNLAMKREMSWLDRITLATGWHEVWRFCFLDGIMNLRPVRFQACCVVTWIVLWGGFNTGWSASNMGAWNWFELFVHVALSAGYAAFFLACKRRLGYAPEAFENSVDVAEVVQSV